MVQPKSQSNLLLSLYLEERRASNILALLIAGENMATPTLWTGRAIEVALLWHMHSFPTRSTRARRISTRTSHGVSPRTWATRYQVNAYDTLKTNDVKLFISQVLIYMRNKHASV